MIYEYLKPPSPPKDRKDIDKDRYKNKYKKYTLSSLPDNLKSIEKKKERIIINDRFTNTLISNRNNASGFKNEYSRFTVKKLEISNILEFIRPRPILKAIDEKYPNIGKITFVDIR